MAIGSPGVVGASGTAGQFDFNSDVQNAQEIIRRPEAAAEHRLRHRPPSPADYPGRTHRGGGPSEPQ